MSGRLAAILCALLVPAVSVVFDWLPAGVLLTLVALPLGLPLIRRLHSKRTGPELISVLKGTARLQLVVAVLMSIGILI